MKIGKSGPKIGPVEILGGEELVTKDVPENGLWSTLTFGKP